MALGLLGARTGTNPDGQPFATTPWPVGGPHRFIRCTHRPFLPFLCLCACVCIRVCVCVRLCARAGNILMDDEGRVVHIDFGFFLSNSPGGVNFEAAPFKLTRELLEVRGCCERASGGAVGS